MSMIINSFRFGGGGDPGGFPYTFPILSTRADTGSSTDWTQNVGTMSVFPTDTTRWLLTNSTVGQDRAYHYQTFSVGSSRHSVIDAGNALIDISTSLGTIASDNDHGCAFVEFYGASSQFLGRAHTANQDPGSIVTNTLNDIFVPPGARSVRVGWQGILITGGQLSASFQDLSCTIKERASALNASAEMLFTEDAADLTGWVNVTGTIGALTYSSTNDYEWQTVQCYFGGSNALTEAYKNLTFPTGWAAKVAAGDARVLLRAMGHSANQTDDLEFILRFNNGSTNPTQTTGRITIGFQCEFVLMDHAVPTDCTSVDIVLKFYRDGGTVNDSCVEKMSVVIYEPV